MDVVLRKLGRGARSVGGRLVRAPRKGSVVVIDLPPQEWSAQTDKAFDDRGIDPWGETVPPPEAGPQFVKDR